MPPRPSPYIMTAWCLVKEHVVYCTANDGSAPHSVPCMTQCVDRLTTFQPKVPHTAGYRAHPPHTQAPVCTNRHDDHTVCYRLAGWWVVVWLVVAVRCRIERRAGSGIRQRITAYCRFWGLLRWRRQQEWAKCYCVHPVGGGADLWAC